MRPPRLLICTPRLPRRPTLRRARCGHDRATTASPADAGTAPALGDCSRSRRDRCTGAAATAAPAAAAPNAGCRPTEAAKESDNFFIRNFKQGGPIMWPILIISIVALTVVIERCFWWGARYIPPRSEAGRESFHRDRDRRRERSLQAGPRFARSGSAHALERIESPARFAPGRACRWPPASRSNAPVVSSW